MTSKQKLNTLVFDMPDSEYHEVLPIEVAYYSSSQLKDARKDPETFYGKYVSKTIDTSVSPQTQSNFDIGSLYHCMVLEPEKVDSQFKLYKGTKRGKAWEDFKGKNEGCIIVNQRQWDTAEFIAKAARNNEVCSDLLNEGSPEVSLFVELHGLRIKVRADWIDFDRGFILDMKSSGGNVKDVAEIKKKISNLDYDLSAALYLDAFNEYLGKKGEPLITEFKWCFDSKDNGASKVYTASDKMIEVGRRKYMDAIDNIKKGIKENWEFPDTDTVLDPVIWDAQEFLTERDEDIL